MTRSALSLVALCAFFGSVACGGSQQPANEPSNSTNTNPSAESGNIEEMTDNTNSPDSVAPNTLRESGGTSNSGGSSGGQ